MLCRLKAHPQFMTRWHHVLFLFYCLYRNTEAINWLNRICWTILEHFLISHCFHFILISLQRGLYTQFTHDSGVFQNQNFQYKWGIGIKKLLSEASKVPWTLFEDKKVAGSATSRTVCLFSHENVFSVFILFFWLKLFSPTCAPLQ